MSGPKCSEYSYDDSFTYDNSESLRLEEERRSEELRRVQEAQRGIEEVSRSLAGLRRSVAEAREKFPHETIDVSVPDQPLPLQMSSYSLEAHLAQLRAALTKAEQDVSVAVGRAEGNSSIRDLLLGIAEAAHTKPKTVAELVANLANAPAAASDRSSEARRERIARIVAPLSEEIIPPAIERLMEIIATESAERAKLLELELRRQVQVLTKERRRTQLDREEAQRLYLSLPAVDSSELDEVRAELLRVSCGVRALSTALRDRVEKVSTEVQKERADLRAAAAAEAALQSLGYETGERFSTLFVEGGEVHFQRPDWGHYLVSLKVNRDDHLINFRVVRTEEDNSTREQKLRDEEMETQWCAEYGGVLEQMSAHGIRTRQVSALAPGARPVQVVKSKGISTPRNGGQRRQPLASKTRTAK